MKRDLSTRSLALLAFGLAVASATFGWRLASRYYATVERFKQDVIIVESKQDELEHQMLNFAALLLKSSEEPPRSYRIQPSDPRIAAICDDGGPNALLLRRVETARADEFLIWYHMQLKKRHLRETRENDASPARPVSAAAAKKDDISSVPPVSVPSDNSISPAEDDHHRPARQSHPTRVAEAARGANSLSGPDVRLSGGVERTSHHIAFGNRTTTGDSARQGQLHAAPPRVFFPPDE